MLKKFSILLFFGMINCSSHAAVYSFWQTEKVHYQVAFTSLIDENLFTSLRLFEVEQDIPTDKYAIKVLKDIYGSKYLNSGNFKLALANLVRDEHNLARVSIAQVTQDGIDKSNKQTYYPNLLHGFGKNKSIYKYSALINRRGTLINVPKEFVDMANFDCVIKLPDYEEHLDVNTPYPNFCSEENINAQTIISSSAKQVISSGSILIENKKDSKESYKVDVIIALDTADIICGDNPTCVSTAYSLTSAFKSLDYKDDKKMELGVYLHYKHAEDTYSINYINRTLEKLAK